MKSEICVRTIGIKGGSAKYKDTGCATLYITDKSQNRMDLVIDADCFTGAGSTYRRRDNTLIEITYKGKQLFIGNIDEFVAILIEQKKDA